MAGSDLPGADRQRPARRPGPRRHPALAVRLLAGDQRPSATAISRFSSSRPSTVQEMVGPDADGLRSGRRIPHARHDPGRRHAGPDDGAGRAARSTKTAKRSRKAVGRHRSRNAKRTHNIINSLYLTAERAGRPCASASSATRSIEEKEHRAEEYMHGGRRCLSSSLTAHRPASRAAP